MIVLSINLEKVKERESEFTGKPQAEKEGEGNKCLGVDMKMLLRKRKANLIYKLH